MYSTFPIEWSWILSKVLIEVQTSNKIKSKVFLPLLSRMPRLPKNCRPARAIPNRFHFYSLISCYFTLLLFILPNQMYIFLIIFHMIGAQILEIFLLHGRQWNAEFLNCILFRFILRWSWLIWIMLVENLFSRLSITDFLFILYRESYS